MIKQFNSVGITEFIRNHKKYMDLVETGTTLYLIRESMIVAKIVKVDFGQEINKTSFLEGGVS